MKSGGRRIFNDVPELRYVQKWLIGFTIVRGELHGYPYFAPRLLSTRKLTDRHKMVKLTTQWWNTSPLILNPYTNLFFFFFLLYMKETHRNTQLKARVWLVLCRFRYRWCGWKPSFLVFVRCLLGGNRCK